jgi:SAM-dependent methyltransferase
MAVEAAIRHFERRSGDYDRLRNSKTLGWLRRDELKALRGMAPIGPRDLVLDAGCGDGDTLAWVASRKAVAIGIDAAFGMAATCRRRGFHVSVQDMEELGLRRRFDWVLCVGSLEFTADPQRAADGFGRVLRERGRLVLLFPRRSPLGSLYYVYHRMHGVRIHLFDRHEITGLLERAGFRRPTEWHDSALSTVCATETEAARR